MLWNNKIPARTFKAVTARDIDRLPQLARLDRDRILSMKAVAAVLPFRVNDYVVEELIDWNDIPRDPVYQLTFPQEGMLKARDLHRMKRLFADGASDDVIRAEARRIQHSLNPHPAGQLELNVPRVGDEAADGLQHKYRETVLFFPSQGQTCHAYCTYCFRWPQFVGLDELRFASHQADHLVEHLRAHPEITDVLITGGDPMIMRTSVLRRYIEPLLDPALAHVQTIRIGSKALAYWPYRFLTDRDADDLMRLFGEVVAAGRHLAFMAHFSHANELVPRAAREATRRILETGAVIRCQAPLIRHVNDEADAWADLWRDEVKLGMVPYYMFVERNTGANHYFEVPLADAVRIYRQAYRRVSGLARTARGPSMSATPGKVVVNGVGEVAGERVFHLSFIQARNPQWVNRPFFARYDPRATWLSDLEPAFGQERFFYEDELEGFRQKPVRRPLWRKRREMEPGMPEWRPAELRRPN